MALRCVVLVQVACFLIAAQRWSYVAVGNGWDGPSSFPLASIFSRRLGAPKADAVVVDAAAGVFTRSFEHLYLHVNVSSWSAQYTWKTDDDGVARKTSGGGGGGGAEDRWLAKRSAMRASIWGSPDLPTRAVPDEVATRGQGLTTER